MKELQYCVNITKLNDASKFATVLSEDSISVHFLCKFDYSL